jgi:hypothetical protein
VRNKMLSPVVNTQGVWTAAMKVPESPELISKYNISRRTNLKCQMTARNVLDQNIGLVLAHTSGNQATLGA